MGSHSWWRRRSVLVIALLAASAGFARAQEASIAGRVVDASGLVIPGATVTATNADTGIKTDGVSNSEGLYAIPLLPPGRYTMTAELQGFTTATRTGVVLEVQQAAKLDFTLEVGGVSETVEVRTPLVDSRTSSLGEVIDNTRIRELPLNGRNPLELSRLTPGVTLLATSFLDTRNFNLTSISINGGQGGTNAVLLDGGSATLPERNEYSVAPNVDAVQEFRVQTNSLAAEFGMTGGGVVNLVTKSGTNQFRGSLFEFLRNDALDATGWTNNRNHLPKSPLNYNQFGGSMGGPIWLPKKLGALAYDGHNRSFFFFNYEGIRYNSSTAVLSRVPTELERRGDFSQTFVRTSSGAFIPVQLYDPASTAANPAGAGVVRTPFGTAVIPTQRLDPAALSAVQHYPSPNRTPDDRTGRNNFISTPELVSNSNQYTGRVDHQIGSANRLFGRYSQQDHFNTGNPAVFGVDEIGDPGLSLQTRHNKSGTIGDTHAFGNGMLNDARLSFSRQYLLSEPAGYNVNAAGQIGLPSTIPGTLFPRFDIGTDVAGELQSLGSSFGQLSKRGLTVVQINDSVSLVKGRHTFKTGVDLRIHQRNNTQAGPISGNFTFTRAMTGNPQDTSGNTGFGLATFLLGSVSGGSLTSDFARADAFQYYGAFVQDDYRVGARLTLNLGVRYDIITPPVDRFDRYSNFNPTATNPVTGTPGVLQYAGVDFGRQAYDTNYNNIGPRAGFAYDLFGSGRTVVRGGYGLFYYHTANFEYPDTQGYSATTTFQSTRGTAFPAFQLAAGPPQIQPPSGSSLGPLSSLGNNVTYFERDRPTPRTHQWNLDLQQELRGSMLVDVAYAGSRGLHTIGFGYDLNQLDPQYLPLGLRLDDRVPNPFFGQIPATAPLGGATISRRQSLRPYPDYLNVTVANPPLGATTYHSAQVKVERRFSSGFGVLSSYTFSRLFGDVGRNVIDFATVGGAAQSSVSCGQDSKFNRDACRSIEPQDVTHQFVLTTLYDLPFGKGRRFLSSGGVLAGIVGGFRLNGILSLHSGLPLVVRGANNGAGAADRPNLVGDPELGSDERTAERWFNTSAFAAPPPFTYGNTPRALEVRGPGFASLDLSLTKDILFNDRFNVQLRAETFNMLNRTNLNLPNTNFLSGQFGQITSAGDPRRVQFGVKLYW